MEKNTLNQFIGGVERMTENREMIQLAAIWMNPGVPVTRPDGTQERGSRITTGDQLRVEWRGKGVGDIIEGEANYVVEECWGDLLSARIELRLKHKGCPPNHKGRIIPSILGRPTLKIK